MAERAYTEKRLGGGVVKVTWEGLTFATTDVGAYYELMGKGPRYGDKTVHVYGTFGAGGKLQMQGTNKDIPSDATNFVLEDQLGNALEFTAVDGEVVMQSPLFMRPAITAGDGNTNLTCEMLIRR